MLTEKQKIFFEKLKELYGKDVLPSFDIIAQEFGFKHKNSVWQYFNKLREENLIHEKNNRFYINKEMFGAVLFSSAVKAGFASVADDYIEKRISLDDCFDINSPSTFLFTVSGDSMIDLGIFEGDKVIVKKSQSAKNGDIVIAFIDDGYTLKTYREKQGKIWLEPANPNYPNLYPKEKLIIFGIVQGIVRKL
ncbi:MAG: translesion error-prone DNA polymerase V autoproteolytic subunit [Candidatus Gastranaerophilales bacterium]|nr:translesion error-prone DNA polymerase V autoproteolytic subunit [Candidatus Gastranaerophilales bacterium]